MVNLVFVLFEFCKPFRLSYLLLIQLGLCLQLFDCLFVLLFLILDSLLLPLNLLVFDENVGVALLDALGQVLDFLD